MDTFICKREKKQNNNYVLSAQQDTDGIVDGTVFPAWTTIQVACLLYKTHRSVPVAGEPTVPLPSLKQIFPQP